MEEETSQKPAPEETLALDDPFIGDDLALVCDPKPATKKGIDGSAYWKLKAKVDLYRVENPGRFDAEHIADLRRLGSKRPDYIPHSEWFQLPDDLGPVEKVACYMAAYGMPNSEIAAQIGRSTDWVSDTLKTRAGKTRVDQLQEKLWGQNPKKWIEEKIVPLAIQTALDIMQDKTVKPQTRAEAAFRFLDRGMGRPKQEIEVHQTSIRIMIEKLDALSKHGVKDLVAEHRKIGEDEGTELEAPVKEDGGGSQKSLLSVLDDEDRDEVDDAADRWVKENL